MDLQSILANAKTIAVVGCSPRTSRTSHRIARYLQEQGFRIIPINPYHEELLGEPCYPDLVSIPDDLVIDIVDIFRRPQFAPDVVNDAIERSKRTGHKPVIWTQIGVHSQEAQRAAEEAGFEYVANRCTLVEHGRLPA